MWQACRKAFYISCSTITWNRSVSPKYDALLFENESKQHSLLSISIARGKLSNNKHLLDYRSRWSICIHGKWHHSSWHHFWTLHRHCLLKDARFTSTDDSCPDNTALLQWSHRRLKANNYQAPIRVWSADQVRRIRVWQPVHQPSRRWQFYQWVWSAVQSYRRNRPNSIAPEQHRWVHRLGWKKGSWPFLLYSIDHPLVHQRRMSDWWTSECR